MKIYVQIIGTDTVDCTPSICLYVENNKGVKRFLFNCGEGTQRFCVQHPVRLARFEHIFLTRLCWEQIGGLPGAILTLADANVKHITITGPKNTAHFLESTRYFISRRDMSLTVCEYTGETTDDILSDKDGSFYPIVITNQPVDTCMTEKEEKQPRPFESDLPIASTIEQKNNMYHITLAKEKKRKRKVSEIISENQSYTPHCKRECTVRLRRCLPPTQRIDNCLCYAYHAPEVAGRFDDKKAIQMGVKRGPEFGKLCRGESVVTAKGTVNPSDIISPTQPGPIVLIIHCPTYPHLVSLVNNASFQIYQINGNLQKQVKLICHITPNELLGLEIYVQWMNSFDPAVEHVVINNRVCSQPIIFTSWTENQIKLNSAHEFIFPLPYADYQPMEKLPKGVPKFTRAGQPLELFNILPIQGWDNRHLLKPLDRAEIFNTFSPEVIQCLEISKKEINMIQSDQNHNLASPHFVFLGTVAAVPSKYRNVTSNFIHIPNFGNIFLDVGEGSTGQLYRRYGPDMFVKHLLGVKIIFISHIHADHHLGLIRILTYRKNIISSQSQSPLPPPLIIGPTALSYWLQEYVEYEPLEYTFIDANAFTQLENPYSELLLGMIGLTRCQAVPVIHCSDAYGVVLEHKVGWKVVYSGDTRPCDRLIECGQNADLVIHEATFEDNLQQEAIDKFHTTTSEAIESSRKMNARFLIMNHFSSRYPKVPVFDTPHGRTSSIAFDLMSITFGDFETLPLLLPVMQAIFKDEPKEDEDEELTPINIEVMKNSRGVKGKSREIKKKKI